MNHRSDLINYYIKKYNLKKYLEIGVKLKTTFNLIDIEYKKCVDPDPEYNADYISTSDNYFKNICQEKFDICFIDGLHECNQVYNDIMNCLNFLNNNGVIILHDILPILEEHQFKPEKRCSKIWNGDCWKAFIKYKYESNYLCYVWKYDFGCGVIDTNKNNNVKKCNFDMNELDWNFYINSKKLFDIRSNYE